jgi:uncharacterized DUF497 family protein
MDFFEWDEAKNVENQDKHGVSFETAKAAFLDPNRLILPDKAHSQQEKRLFCIGSIPEGVVTVRFTYRGHKIRIFGAAFWRDGRRKYSEYRGRSKR